MQLCVLSDNQISGRGEWNSAFNREREIMAITYGSDDLFSSGPARVDVGGLSLRYAQQKPLSARGLRLFSQGLSGRVITQTGELTADTAEGLHGQREAIEQKLDGCPRALVDDRGRTWSGVVMVAFEPGQLMRLGVRWKVAYRIEYVQPSDT